MRLVGVLWCHAAHFRPHYTTARPVALFSSGCAFVVVGPTLARAIHLPQPKSRTLGPHATTMSQKVPQHCCGGGGGGTSAKRCSGASWPSQFLKCRLSYHWGTPFRRQWPCSMSWTHCCWLPSSRTTTASPVCPQINSQSEASFLLHGPPQFRIAPIHVVGDGQGIQ